MASHKAEPRFARPSEGGEGFVCKVCGKPVSKLGDAWRHAATGDAKE